MGAEIDYEIHDPPGIIIQTLKGVIGAQEIMGLVDRLNADPKFHTGLTKLVDTSGIEDYRMTSADMHRVFHYKVARGCVEQRVAVIADQDHCFGMARMYEAISGDHHSDGIRVFRKREDAFKWLGLSMDELTPSLISPPIIQEVSEHSESA